MIEISRVGGMKMYTILIVDDEKVIREGLVKFVNWEKFDFQVGAVASSAEEAIELIRKIHIDVILTDIVMEKMSGIELVEKISEIQPSIKVIAVSGYDEFEYVRQMLRFGAIDYLTKPVKLKELEKTLIKVKNIIDEERHSFQNLVEQYLNNLIKGYYHNVGEVYTDFLRVGIKFHGNHFFVCRIYVESTEDKKGLKYTLSTSLKEYYAGNEFFVFDNDLNELAVLFCTEDVNEAVELLSILCGDKMYISVGSVQQDIMQISQSYSEAGYALEYRMLKKAGTILRYSDLIGPIEEHGLLDKNDEKRIFSYLDSCDFDALSSCISDIINSLKNNKNGSKYVYSVCIDIILRINKYMSTNISKDFQDKSFEYIRNMLYKNNIDEIRLVLQDYLNKCHSIIEGSKDVKIGLIINNAKQYIDEHYNERITLGTLSEQVYIHPIYLSKLFKEKIGQNFIDYLTKVRVEHAKEMLKNPSLKICDIAYMVGYESPKHFSKIFKDVVGISPKDYRNKALGLKELMLN